MHHSQKGWRNDTTDKRTESDEHKTSQDIFKASTDEVEKVMASGMQFLSGLLKMSTGKDFGFENQEIHINKETGEVTMTFKLPI